MSAALYDLEIEQGSTFSIDITYQNDSVTVDLNGYSARLHIREDYSGTLIDSLTSSGSDSEIVLGNGTTPITPPNIRITIPASETAKYTFDEAVYDLEIEHFAVVTKLLRGTIKLIKEVTL